MNSNVHSVGSADLNQDGKQVEDRKATNGGGVLSSLLTSVEIELNNLPRSLRNSPCGTSVQHAVPDELARRKNNLSDQSANENLQQSFKKIRVDSMETDKKSNCGTVPEVVIQMEEEKPPPSTEDMSGQVQLSNKNGTKERPKKKIGKKKPTDYSAQPQQETAAKQNPMNKSNSMPSLTIPEIINGNTKDTKNAMRIGHKKAKIRAQSSPNLLATKFGGKGKTCEIATQWEAKDQAATWRGEKAPSLPTLRRRHTTGGITKARINRANLKATIRRQQQRRFRAPRQSAAVKLIHVFLLFLYYTGLSPLRPSSAKHLPKMLLWLQMVCYWSFAAISVLQVLDDVKYGWMNFNGKEDMPNLVYLGFYMANFLTRVYTIILLATSSAPTSTLLEKVNTVNRRGTQNTDKCNYALAVGIGVLSVFIAGLSTIFGYVDLDLWSFGYVLKYRSLDIIESLFVWKSDKVSDRFEKLIGNETTMTTTIFGTIGSVLNYCGTLHSCVILDLWAILSFQVYFLQLHFSAAFCQTKALNHTRQCPLSINWKYYMALREVCDEIDHVFGNMFKLIHLQNMLSFSFCLIQLLSKLRIQADFLIELFSLVKISFTYILIQKSVAKNEDYQDCVIRCSNHRTTINIDKTQKNVGVLVYDMQKHPVGIGRGEFLVDETFIIKFLCVVGPIFMLLTGEKNDSCKNQ